MTNSVNEILDAELLFVIGSNTTEAHPIIGNKMKQAVRNGTKLIVVDPRTTELAAMADLHPVSYTHLDVYKRQAVICRTPNLITLTS